MFRCLRGCTLSCYLLTMLLTSSTILADASNVFTVEKADAAINSVSYLEDKKSSYQIDELLSENISNRFQENTTSVLNLGLTDKVIWVKSYFRIEADKNGMAGLSLREVTKAAGVSPTAFYRHFADLEELGLAVVEESSGMLRRMLRDVRKAESPADMISKSVEIFVRYVLENRALWLMLTRERVGGSARIRAAIRNQITHYSTELASDLRLLNVLPQMTQSDLQRLANMVIALAVNSAADILDLPTDQPREAKELIDYLNRQMQILILGAINWKPSA